MQIVTNIVVCLLECYTLARFVIRETVEVVVVKPLAGCLIRLRNGHILLQELIDEFFFLFRWSDLPFVLTPPMTGGLLQ